jgi:hypothetical protein
LQRLEREAGSDEIKTRLLTKIDGWDAISDAQSVLAHSCITSFFFRSKKFEFLFAELKQFTQCLQQKFEEDWTGQNLEKFPEFNAKAAISNLRHRLKDFLIAAQSELDNRALSLTLPRQNPSTRVSGKDSAPYPHAVPRPASHNSQGSRLALPMPGMPRPPGVNMNAIPPVSVRGPPRLLPGNSSSASRQDNTLPPLPSNVFRS